MRTPRAQVFAAAAAVTYTGCRIRRRRRDRGRCRGASCGPPWPGSPPSWPPRCRCPGLCKGTDAAPARRRQSVKENVLWIDKLASPSRSSGQCIPQFYCPSARPAFTCLDTVPCGVVQLRGDVMHAPSTGCHVSSAAEVAEQECTGLCRSSSLFAVWTVEVKDATHLDFGYEVLAGPAAHPVVLCREPLVQILHRISALPTGNTSQIQSQSSFQVPHTSREATQHPSGSLKPLQQSVQSAVKGCAARACSGVKTPTGAPTGMPRSSRTATTLVLWPKALRKDFGCRSSGMKLQPDQWLWQMAMKTLIRRRRTTGQRFTRRCSPTSGCAQQKKGSER